MTVHVLVTARQRTAADNLQHALAEARASVAFGADLDYDAMVWPLPRDRARHPSMNTPRALYFSRNPPGGKRTHVHHSKRAEADVPLERPFADLLKAYVRIAESNRPRKLLTDYVNMVRAGRYLHDVLALKGYDPCLLTTSDFQAAFAAFDAGGPSGSARYNIGSHLSRIAAWVVKRGIPVARIDFRNPVSNKELGTTGARAYSGSGPAPDSKLPSDRLLDALADIATRVKTDQDVLLMRTVELLVCAPWRIAEVMALPVDCEVTQHVTERGQPVLDEKGQPTIAYGLRYRGGKGHGWDVKWIPSAMVDVARRAIRDIRRITEPCRETARWLAANPGRAWVPEPWTGADPETMLTTIDVSTIVAGKADPIFGRDFIVKGKVPHRRDGWRYEVRLGDVEAALLRRMDELHGDHAAIPREQHLLLVPGGFFGATRIVKTAIVRHLPYYDIQNFLTGRANVASAFERFGCVDDVGAPLRMASHQLRHWLNTLAQRKGLSQIDIARWSGRRSVAQNQAYNHMTGVELAERARELMDAGRMKGALADMADTLPPADRSAFLASQIATAHTTDIGMCVNDWSLAPCHHHGSCADCCDHLVVKGDTAQRERAETLLAETEHVLVKARQEMADESYGASNWVAHQERMLAGVRSILAVHDDPSVPDGTLVQANPTGASRSPPRIAPV